MSIHRWLAPGRLAAAVAVAGTLLATAPVQAQTATVLRGPVPVAQPSASVDCNNPYYYQYCQAYAAWYNQYYAPYSYGDDYLYYGYGFPVAGFHGRFHGGGFHGGGFHGGGFHGGGFHGGGFHGGGFHGGGLHGGSGHR